MSITPKYFLVLLLSFLVVGESALADNYLAGRDTGNAGSSTKVTEKPDLTSSEAEEKRPAAVKNSAKGKKPAKKPRALRYPRCSECD